MKYVAAFLMALCAVAIGADQASLPSVGSLSVGGVNLTTDAGTNLTVAGAQVSTTEAVESSVGVETATRELNDRQIRVDIGTVAFVNDNGRLNLTTSFFDSFDDTNGVSPITTNVSYDAFANRWAAPSLSGVTPPTYFWKADDSNANSTVTDTMGNSDGTYVRFPGFTPLNTEDYSVAGKLGGAIGGINLTNVVDTGLSMSDIAGNSVGLSIETWVYLQDGRPGGGEDHFLGFGPASGGPYIFLLNGAGASAGKLLTRIADASVNYVSAQISNPLFADGDIGWQHIVATYDYSGNITLYVNGSQPVSYGLRETFAAKAYDYTDMAGGSNVLAIGGVNETLYNLDRRRQAQSDQTKIWVGTVLTQADVTELYNAGAGSSEISPGSTSGAAEFESAGIPLISFIPTNGAMLVWVTDVTTPLTNGNVLAYISDDGGTNETQVQMVKSSAPTVSGGPTYAWYGTNSFPGVSSNLHWRVVFTNAANWYFDGVSVGYSD